jgi:very-short-patch-repair endonuclease
MLALLGAQHGVISAQQLDDVGMSPGQLRTAVRNGWLERVAPSVYASPAAPRSVDFGRTLGLLALGGETVVSHLGAAALLGLDRSDPTVVEFTVPRSMRGLVLPYVVHTTKYLPPIDRTTVNGYPCTSGSRTVVDLARSRVSTIKLEAAIDSSVRLGYSSPWVLVDRLAELRGPGRWGVRLLDELLRDAGGHTMLERRFLRLVRRAGLPRPQTQVIHRRDGRTFARVDFLFVEHDVVVEVTGRKGHSTPSERARDAQRRNELQDVGKRVYEYTWEHVTECADWVIETLRQRLGPASIA